MPADASAFSKWALDDARTADARYLIFLVCETCWRLRFPGMALASFSGTPPGSRQSFSQRVHGGDDLLLHLVVPA
jgi:hypothetical protein